MTITENLQHLHQQIHWMEEKYKRPHGSVKLLAASKQQNIDKIEDAISAGQNCFGENYLQEALTKITTLKNHSIQWHFIGKLQVNKTRLIAQHFSWVHGIDRLKIAERLSAQRPSNFPPLNVCIALNISQEEQKSGVTYDQLFDLAHHVSQLENLHLRGLMAIPKPTHNFSEQFNIYQQVQQAQKDLCARGLELDTLSMGMSNDFEAAIAAGSTMVRIGTAIFGEREIKIPAES